MGASILTGPWDERPMNCGSIPSSVSARTYFSFPKWSDRLLGHTHTTIQRALWLLFAGLKRPGLKTIQCRG